MARSRATLSRSSRPFRTCSANSACIKKPKPRPKGHWRMSTKMELTDLAEAASPEIGRGPRDLEAVYDIPVTVSAVLGKSTMQVSQLLKLGRGAVVELDRKLGEAIDIYVNNRLIARGEVVMVDDTRLGVTMTEIVKSE